jgi:stage II sporulation protein D
MTNKIVTLTLFFFLFSIIVSSQPINIGVLNDKNPKKFLIESLAGKYKIKSGRKTVCRLKKDRSVIVTFINGTLNLSNERKDYGLYRDIHIVVKYNFNQSHSKEKSRKNAELNIRLIDPKLTARTYQGNMSISCNEKKMTIINHIAMPDYLAGVVEAESGSKCEFEYYKNQAVICRTYAINSHDKHQGDGYNLCDGVHCQAYKGKSTTNPLIQKAVAETDNLVIVDNEGRLISALFSANCGGQSNNSEDVWSNPLSYLRSINDSFCTDQPQATWKKTIAFTDFKSFLKEKKLVFPDTLSIDSFAFAQPARKVMYTLNGQEIKLTVIRFGLGLRSTFFEIKPDGKNLIISGRGYGHGVGMCQEGAMNMARKGYKFDAIIKYYYKGVDIVPVGKAKK